MPTHAAVPREAARWLRWHWLRRRAVAMVPIVVVTAVGMGAAAFALSSATLTEGAFRSYLRRAEVGNLIVNPVVNTQEIDDVIRSHPGVTAVSSASLFAVSFDDGGPRTRWELLAAEGVNGNTLGSSDGRFSEMDRPVVLEGRMATDTRELVVTAEAAETNHWELGDTISIAFWSDNVSTGEDIDGYMDEIIEPIAVESVRLVGIVLLPDHVLPDELHGTEWAIVSPDLAATYGCTPSLPAPGRTLQELHDALLPPGCAVRYHHYSLWVPGGATQVKTVLDQLVATAKSLNEDLEDISDLPHAGPLYNIVAIESASTQARLERAIEPMVTALVVLGAATALVAGTLTLLAAARELRRSDSDRSRWRLLGVSGHTSAVVVSTPIVAAVATGLALGLAAAWVASPKPLGVVGVLAEGRGSLAPVAVAVVALAGALVTALVVFLAVRTAGSSGSTRREPRIGPSLTARVLPGSPAVADGVGAALTSRGASPLIGGCAVVSAVVVAAVIFGTSLANLVATPRAYGWPWDVSLMTGNGYFGLDLDLVEEALRDDPAVEGWTVLGFTGEVTLDGRPTATLIDYGRRSGGGVQLARGALPANSDEVAIGRNVAAERGLSVGDEVELGGVFSPPRSMVVSGIVVFPALGPVSAERLSPGEGLLVSEDTLAESVYGPEVVRVRAAFVGVDLSATDPASEARVLDALASADFSGFPPNARAGSVRPPEIIDAGASRSAPYAVGAVAAAIGFAGLAFAAWASERNRRRHLCVLRALGFTGAQLRLSVMLQSIVTMAAGLVLGVPLGLLAGRVLWRQFAEQLGVISTPASPVASLLSVSAAALVAALLVAAAPARTAARRVPSTTLRSE